MVGGKALAESAAIESIHALVRHLGQALVTEVVSHAGLLQPLSVQLRLGDDGDLYFVHDGFEVGVEAGVEDFAEMFQVKTFFGRSLAETNPGDVALADVLDARRTVDEVVNLSLQHWLEVLLHLPPGHLDDDPHVHVSPLFDVLEAGADDLDFAVLHLVHGSHTQVLEGAGVLAAELDPHVGSAHPLALERAAVGNGDGHLSDLHLDAAHLDAALHQSPGLLGIRLSLDVVEGHGDDVLVLGDAGRQYLGDDGIGDDWEAIVDGARSSGVLQIIHLTQSQGEGEDPELVVEQHSSGLAAFHAAKGQRRAGGEASGIDGGDGVRAEGHDVGIVAHFDTLFHQLMDDAPSVDVAGEEDENVTLLQLPHDLDSRLVGLGSADDGREAGHPPVHQLDAPGAQLDVINGAVNIAARLLSLHVGAGEAGAGELQARHRLWLLAVGETDTLDGLLRKKCGHSAVEGLTKIGQPDVILRPGVQQRLGPLNHGRQITDLTNLQAGEAQDDGEIVRRVRELNRRVRPQFFQGLL